MQPDLEALSEQQPEKKVLYSFLYVLIFPIPTLSPATAPHILTFFALRDRLIKI